jgi:uncharacterized surface protein with fasciclin (FAS1) repeats
MKKIIHSLNCIFIFAAISIIGCKKENKIVFNVGTEKISELIKKDTALSIFNAVLQKTHLNVYSEGPGPFTYFVPNNMAYNKMGIRSSADIAQLDSIELLGLTSALIAPGNKASYYLAGLNVPVATVPNTSIAATALPDAVFFNGFKAYKPDVLATNGVMHIMSDFIPPTLGTTTVTLGKFPDKYKLFLQAINRATGGATLVNANTTTLFAPNNDAMVAGGYDSVAISKATAANLATLVKYHLVTTKYYVFALKNGDLKTALGKNVTLNINVPVPTVKGLQNTTPTNFNFSLVGFSTGGTVFNGVNLSTTNGVIHTIDAVLKP